MASPDATLVTISNTNDPIITPDGNPLAGVSVTFRLVNENERPEMMLDAVSRELVASTPVTVVTNANGELSVDLWPNNRGLERSCYKVTMDDANIKPFYILVATNSTLYAAAAAYVLNGPMSSDGTLTVDGGEIDGNTDNILDGGVFP